MSNLTQREQLLRLLRSRGSKGAYVYELQAPKPQGLGLAQYNARIFELRAKGFNIVNVEEGHFVLMGESNSQPSNFQSDEIVSQVKTQVNVHEEVQTRINNLREKLSTLTSRVNQGVSDPEYRRLNTEITFLNNQIGLLQRALPNVAASSNGATL